MHPRGMPQFGAGKYSERKTTAEVDLCMESCGLSLLHHTALPVPTKQPSVRPPRAHPVKFEAFQDPARFPLPFDPYYEIHLPFTCEGSSAAYRETSGTRNKVGRFICEPTSHVPFLICSTAEGKKRASKNGLIYRACFSFVISDWHRKLPGIIRQPQRSSGPKSQFLFASLYNYCGGRNPR